MNEARTPYWWAFLKHPYNRLVAMGMLSMSLLLSLPWGGDGFGMGMLALAAVQMVGLAIVPGLPSFQLWADKQSRGLARETRREGLTLEIKAHGGSPHLRSYEQMCARVASLYRTAADRSTALTVREVEQLDDVTVDYLRMCLSDAVARGGYRGDPAAGVARKLHEVEAQINAGALGRDDEQQLLRAKADYEEAIRRQTRMVSRRSALDASLVSMPVRLEEVYQMVMASPRAGNLGQLLEESVSKLKLAEEAALDMERLLGPARFEPAPVKAAAASPAASGRRAIDQRE